MLLSIEYTTCNKLLYTHSLSFFLPSSHINRNFITHRHLRSLSFSDSLDSKSKFQQQIRPRRMQIAIVFLVQTDLYSPTYLPEFDETKFLRGHTTLKVCKQNSRASELKLSRVARAIDPVPWNFALTAHRSNSRSLINFHFFRSAYFNSQIIKTIN